MNTDIKENQSQDKPTEVIIGAAILVSNTIGCGFLEKVYENALAIELTKLQFKVEQQKPLVVYYRNIVVGEYTADIIVNQAVILELKASKMIDPIHLAQLLNYLKASKMRTGLLLNFGTPRLGVKRLVL